MVPDGLEREAVLASVHGGRSCPPEMLKELLKVLTENPDRWEAADVYTSLVDVDGREDVWQLWLLIFEECGVDMDASRMALQRYSNASDYGYSRPPMKGAAQRRAGDLWE